MRVRRSVLRWLPRVESRHRQADCLADRTRVRHGALGEARDPGGRRRRRPTIKGPFAPGGERHGGWVGEPRLRAGAFSHVKNKVVKKGGTYAVFCCRFGCRKSGYSSVLHVLCRVPKHPSASPQYERVPSLTTAKVRRKSAKNLLARSPKIHTGAWLLIETHILPVEKKCITAGKDGQLQWEWCDRQRTHFQSGFR